MCAATPPCLNFQTLIHLAASHMTMTVPSSMSWRMRRCGAAVGGVEETLGFCIRDAWYDGWEGKHNSNMHVMLIHLRRNFRGLEMTQVSAELSKLLNHQHFYNSMTSKPGQQLSGVAVQKSSTAWQALTVIDTVKVAITARTTRKMSFALPAGLKFDQRYPCREELQVVPHCSSADNGGVTMGPSDGARLEGGFVLFPRADYRTSLAGACILDLFVGCNSHPSDVEK
ncbi:hypothetical protein BDR05DRAFT_988057 [Suillus weaverae]|nr:hypothetical protein BDR05DRAFT_988057 [Suillus weaverae]